jgi:thiamine-phosphate diphosphorylase
VLGATCHNVTEAQFAEERGATYISVGCLYPSKSKQDTIPTSLAELHRIQQAVSLPICAIGGINRENLAAVLESKVNMIAMISSIWQEADPKAAIQAMKLKMDLGFS